MGWYQWQLFIVVGFGWANDNLWPIVTSLIRPFPPSAPPGPHPLNLVYRADLLSDSHCQRVQTNSPTGPLPSTEYWSSGGCHVLGLRM